jgi:hypothetical protein
MTEYVKITEGVRAYLDLLTGRVRNPREPLLHLVPEIRAFFARQFETAGSEGGQSWAPLSAATMERHGVRPQMLMETGTLWASLTQEGAKYSYAILNGDSIRVGTRDPVAHLLRDGTRRGIPPRDIEGEPPAPTQERWSDLVADDLLKE